jgi:hypothetical protein
MSALFSRRVPTFFEIDKDFESMAAVVKSNFVTVDSLLVK